MRSNQGSAKQRPSVPQRSFNPNGGGERNVPKVTIAHQWEKKTTAAHRAGSGAKPLHGSSSPINQTNRRK